MGGAALLDHSYTVWITGLDPRAYNPCLLIRHLLSSHRNYAHSQEERSQDQSWCHYHPLIALRHHHSSHHILWILHPEDLRL